MCIRDSVLAKRNRVDCFQKFRGQQHIHVLCQIPPAQIVQIVDIGLKYEIVDVGRKLLEPVSYTHLVINNGRRGEELEKAQEYAERATPEKPSIRERLEDAKRECAEHKPPEGKKPGRDVPEHDCL